MNTYQTYRRPEPFSGWTRIDLLLALFDGALERLDRAQAALTSGNLADAVAAQSRAQLIVSGLAAGVRLEGNEVIGQNLLRLYEFVSHELKEPKAERVANSRKILKTLREGFEGIRAEAASLERNGGLANAESLHMVQTSA